MDDLLPFGSPAYCLVLAVLLVARGMDFLSTWIATPNLKLEANPIARKLGWKGGTLLNLGVCLAFAIWPLPAIVIITTSLLVAARNFQSAWLMRLLGEDEYRSWICERVSEVKLGLYLFCLISQTVLFAGIGGVLVYFSDDGLIPFAVGTGIITYALAILIFAVLSLCRVRRSASRYGVHS